MKFCPHCQQYTADEYIDDIAQTVTRKCSTCDNENTFTMEEFNDIGMQANFYD